MTEPLLQTQFLATPTSYPELAQQAAANEQRQQLELHFRLQHQLQQQQLQHQQSHLLQQQQLMQPEFVKQDQQPSVATQLHESHQQALTAWESGNASSGYGCSSASTACGSIAKAAIAPAAACLCDGIGNGACKGCSDCGGCLTCGGSNPCAACSAQTMLGDLGNSAASLAGCVGGNACGALCGAMCSAIPCVSGCMPCMGGCMPCMAGCMPSMCGGMCQDLCGTLYAQMYAQMYAGMCGGFGGAGGCMGCAGIDGGTSSGLGGLGVGMLADGLHVGTVKTFNEEKGWGHIASDTAKAMYGKDIFLMRSALRGGRIKVGDRVQFSVQTGSKGPQAADVKSLEVGSEWTQQDVDDKKFCGKIKQFSEEKGWGFIACDETHKMFGKDMFVHKREFGGHSLKLGDEVTFTVEFSSDNRPEAKHIAIMKSGRGGYGPAMDNEEKKPPAARDGPY